MKPVHVCERSMGDSIVHWTSQEVAQRMVHVGLRLNRPAGSHDSETTKMLAVFFAGVAMLMVATASSTEFTEFKIRSGPQGATRRHRTPDNVA